MLEALCIAGLLFILWALCARVETSAREGRLSRRQFLQVLVFGAIAKRPNNGQTRDDA